MSPTGRIGREDGRMAAGTVPVAGCSRQGCPWQRAPAGLCPSPLCLLVRQAELQRQGPLLPGTGTVAPRQVTGGRSAASARPFSQEEGWPVTSRGRLYCVSVPLGDMSPAACCLLYLDGMVKPGTSVRGASLARGSQDEQPQWQGLEPRPGTWAWQGPTGVALSGPQPSASASGLHPFAHRHP